MSFIPPESNIEGVGITREFLESAMSEKWSRDLCRISKFKLSRGCSLGDGFTTMLVTVQVWLENREKFLENFEWDWHVEGSDRKKLKEDKKSIDEPDLTLVIKHLPDKQSRQDYIEAWDLFTTEVAFYSQSATKLIEFQKHDLKSIVKPPLPPFVSGRALNAEETKKLKETRPMILTDNYLMLVDIRKHGNFLVRDRFLSLDLEHCKLGIEALAKLHAMSWAYQYHLGIDDLRSIHPFLQKSPHKYSKFRMESLVKAQAEIARKVVKDELRGDEDILKGIDDLVDEGKMIEALALYQDYEPQWDASLSKDDVEKYVKPLRKFTKDSILRTSGSHDPNEASWKVLIHGDARTGNMMFRYDPTGTIPVQVILLDMQSSRIGDPMTDLVYNIYTETTSQFRCKHLDLVLQVYFDTFLNICKMLSCPPLPNFTREEFQRRFHRAKIYGLTIGIISLPIILTNPEFLAKSEKLADKEKQESIKREKDNEMKGDGGASIENKAAQSSIKHGLVEDYATSHPQVKIRLAGLLQDMRDDEVL